MKTLPRRPAAEGIAQPLLVPHASLAPDPEQPRRSGLEQGLAGLLESIRAHGVIQPILVRPHPDPSARAATPYMIVLGERRWTAAGRAGRDEVPVFLLDHALSPGDRLMLQVEENDGDNRQDLSLYDLATAVARAVKLEGVSQAQFALRHRRSTAWVSQLLALANAGGLLGEALHEGRLRGRLVARTFQRLPEHHQRELLAQARRHNTPISLAAAEKLANRAERQAHPATAGTAATAAPPGSPLPDDLDQPAVATPDAAPAADSRPTSLPPPATSTSAASRAGTASPASQPPPAAATSASQVSTAAGADPAPARDATAVSLPAAVWPPPTPTLTFESTAPDSTPAAGPTSDGTPAGPAPAALLHYRTSSTRPPAALPPAAGGSGPAEPAVPLLASSPTAGVGLGAATAQPAHPPAAASPAGAREPANPSAAATPYSPPAAATSSHAPRSAAAGLLAAASPFVDPFAAGRSVSGDPAAVTDSHSVAAGRITLNLSLAQLQKLLRLLGHEPAATPPALVHQLLTAL
jgi:ParB/RepB/Spo0J family partition protein